VGEKGGERKVGEMKGKGEWEGFERSKRGWAWMDDPRF